MTDKAVKLKVGINGAKGNMGKITFSAVHESPDMVVAFQTDRGDDLASAIQETGAEVVVDFTVPDAVFSNSMTIIENKARPVIGTTGLAPEEVRTLDEALRQRKLGGIVAPNFSLGAILMMKLSSIAARYMKHCEIIESHHEKKIDSPSGTALMTAARLEGPLLEETPDALRGTLPETAASQPSRGLKKGPVTIHSVRLPGHLAHQQVIFGGLGESLYLTHNIVSRESFIPGILMAIRSVMEIEGMQEGVEI